MEWLYKGIEHVFFILLFRSIIFKLIAFLLVFTCVKTENDYSAYAFIIIFATVGSGVVNLYNLRKIITIKYFSNYDFKRHLKPMMTFFYYYDCSRFLCKCKCGIAWFYTGK